MSNLCNTICMVTCTRVGQNTGCSYLEFSMRADFRGCFLSSSADLSSVSADFSYRKGINASST